MTHLRRLLTSSLAESAAARALMKCIQVASMLLASSRFGTKAQSALDCTAGLTTWMGRGSKTCKKHFLSGDGVHFFCSQIGPLVSTGNVLLQAK